jgi:hypothetical protein
VVGLAAVASLVLLYNHWSKQLGVGKPLAVAMLMTSLYPLALAQAGEWSGPRLMTLAVFPAWMLLSVFSYTVYADLRDRAGDRVVRESAVNASSCRVAVGRRMGRLSYPDGWRVVADVCALTGAAVLLGPTMLGCGWMYAAFVVPAMAAPILAARSPAPQAVRFMAAECMLVGLAATADLVVLGP